MVMSVFVVKTHEDNRALDAKNFIHEDEKDNKLYLRKYGYVCFC